MSNLRERLASLSPEQRTQLMQKMKKRRRSESPPEALTSPNGQVSIVPVPRDRQLPLSYAQQRLWFLAQLEGGEVYNVFGAIRLIGKLDIEALQSALQAVVDRHEILRTTYQAIEGEPYQVIASHMTLPLPVVDLQSLPTDEQAEAVEQQIAEARATSFDLSQDVMLCVRLLALTEQEHILLLIVHHIATDAWSNGLLIQEVATLYDTFTQSSPLTRSSNSTPLAPLPVQYADFAHWQRAQNIEEHLAYWTHHLGGTLPTLDLPIDYMRPQVQNHRGAALLEYLPEALSNSLKELAQQERVTLFMLLLATFKVVLLHHTDQEDMIVGTPTAGRNQPATEPLIGLFLNTLALRTDLSGNPTFQELLARVRQVTLDAYAHQDVPFEKLVETLQPERSLGRHPIFEVMLNLINVPRKEIKLSGLRIQPIDEPERDAKFTMTLYIAEEGGKLSLHLVYQQSLFSTERMTHFLEQFKMLLTQVVDNPYRPIRNYTLLTPLTQSLLPNPSEPLLEPDYEPIPMIFAAWADRMPDWPAIEWNGQTWTYRQLVENAKKIAQALFVQGVAKGDVVAVYGRRSYGTIASMMGVLFGGSVLLNIADNLPTQRKRVMLREAKVKLLLNVGMEENLLNKSLLVNPNTGEPDSSEVHEVHDNPLPRLIGKDAAYIFFTSGTTGIPKGVLGNHKGLAHFLAWQRKRFDVRPSDRSAQLTGLSFDVVLRDIFLPLTSGATLCLPEPGIELEPQRVLRWLQESKITLLHIVPSLAQSWLAAQTNSLCYHLRWSFFAGEPLTDTLIRQWRKVFVHSEIANMYGPTETTMAKCCYQVPHEPLSGVQPVGTPLPQTQALVLNAQNQMCSIGEVGQIVIRTPFRTDGYINDVGQTSRFAKNPYGDDDVDLLYYTGDQGRYRPDGTLDILGRVDDQVKIRGIRIELGEIKATLDEHPAVGASVVIAHQEGEDKYLAAYIVPVQQSSFNLTDVRRYLDSRLPTAMIPSAIVELDCLPLTPNGKVNRQALPIPEIHSSATYLAPRDSTEQQLVEIWQNILETHPIGVQDSFFDLGGHSLLAVRLMSAVHQQFNQNLPLATLFQSPTIEEIAIHLRNGVNGSSQAWSPLVQIQPKGSKPPFFCVPGAGGNVLYFYHLSRYLGKVQPFVALQALGLDGLSTPHSSIEEMAASYIKAVQTVQPQGPYYLGGHSFGGKVAFEMAQQLHKEGHQVAFLALFDSSVPTGVRDDRMDSWDDARWFVEVAAVISDAVGKEVLIDYETTQGLTPEAQLLAFKEALETIRFLPASADINQVRGWVNVFKANWQMPYAPQDIHSLPLTLFRAREASESEYKRRLQGWHQLGSVEVYTAPGSHMTMLNEPHVQVLAKQLADCLAVAQAQAVSLDSHR